MIADALDHGPGSGIADAEALGGTPAEERLAAGGAVENHIADQYILVRHEGARSRRVDDQPAA